MTHVDLRSAATRAHAAMLRAAEESQPGSGRIVVRTRRVVAASERPHADDVPRAPRPWAHTTVYASRVLSADEVLEGTGLAADLEAGPAGESRLSPWTVREIDARRVPGSRGPRCLVFENHQIVRRVWAFPASWVTLPAAALLRLAGLR